MHCEICNKYIMSESQYINGKYYHNACIEQLQKENQKLKKQLEYLRSREMKDTYLSIVKEHGEFDFEVSGLIQDLSLEEYNELRKMLIVAIGTMEEMFRNKEVE